MCASGLGYSAVMGRSCPLRLPTAHTFELTVIMRTATATPIALCCMPAVSSRLPLTPRGSPLIPLTAPVEVPCAKKKKLACATNPWPRALRLVVKSANGNSRMARERHDFAHPRHPFQLAWLDCLLRASNRPPCKGPVVHQHEISGVPSWY